ncbi:hypothetical protein [Aquibacillus kalidii]|uniref:hypothetical protein n=1 Tax=Aquibacillus kalidii TaxID=2762597 RepID=UPI00164627A6|nr:hypothetical protein [Aquibacillus kalidii]
MARNDEDLLEKKLKQLPQFRDDQSKEELYQKISRQVERESPRNKIRRQWLVPTMASAFGIVLLVLIVKGSFIDMQYSQEESSSGMEESALSDEANMKRSTKDELITGEQELNQSLDKSSKEDSTVLMKALNSKAAYDNNANVAFIPVAALTNSAQYIVPISIVDPTSTKKEVLGEYYNSINAKIKEFGNSSVAIEEELGISLFPFEGITFNLNQDEQVVQLSFDEGYQMPGGSSIQGLFDPILSIMFSPQNIKQAILTNVKEGQLGNMGVIEEIQLDPLNNYAYKIYRPKSNMGYEYLVPTQKVDTLDEAFAQMRISEPEFEVYASIPEETDLHVTTEKEQISFSFSNASIFGNDQTTLDMIDSLLLTAKSFGYRTVRFELPFEKLGPYNLTKAIEVPDGANPFILK